MSGSAELRASLQLTLRDDMLAGLQGIKDMLRELRDLAQGLSLKGLNGAGADLSGATAGLRRVADGLDTVRTDALQAAGAIRDIRSATDGLGVIHVGGDGVAHLGGLPRGPGDVEVLPREGIVPRPVPIPPSAVQHRGGGNDAMDGLLEGAAVLEPTKAYADFSGLLTQIAITEGLKGQAAEIEIDRLTKLFNSDALASGQSSESIAQAYYDLLGQGIARTLLDKTIGLHSKAATAYGISAEDLGVPVGSLLGTLGIDETTLGGALAAMATASKSGRFKIPDFKTELPNVAGQSALIGLKGRGGVDEIFAIMETLMKTTGQPSSAAAELNDLISYIFTSREDNRFKKLHIDLPTYLDNAKARGLNELDAFMGLLRKITAGKNDHQILKILTPLIMNQTARQGAIALLTNGDFEKALQQRLDGVQADTLTNDVATAMQGANVQMQLMTETLEQTNRALGQDFLPTIKAIGEAMRPVNAGLQAMNETGFGSGLLKGLGAVLGLLAGLAGLGYAVKLLKGGFVGLGLIEFVEKGGKTTMMLGPLVRGIIWAATAIGEFIAGLVLADPILLGIALLIGGLAVAAIAIYKNWDELGKHFHELVAGLKQEWQGFLDWFHTGGLSLNAAALGATPQILAAKAALPANQNSAVGGGGSHFSGQIHVKVTGAPATVTASSPHPGVQMTVVGSAGNTTRRP